METISFLCNLGCERIDSTPILQRINDLFSFGSFIIDKKDLLFYLSLRINISERDFSKFRQRIHK